MATICLNMIVKNESSIICKTLENLCSYIIFDYWVISDTGSTDNTKELIINFFKEKNIKGELVEHVWEDFGTNRTHALNAAFNKTDYLLIFDADDEIIGKFILPDGIGKQPDTIKKQPNGIGKQPDTIKKLNEIESLKIDAYKLKFGPDFIYYRILIVNNRKKWKFEGVLHEYICPEFKSKPIEFDINGDYYLISGRTGNRSQNPNKYRDDAIILKNAFTKNLKSEYGLACRYAFYCAQSYHHAELNNESITWYKKCLELDNWHQEKYYSCLNLGEIYLLPEFLNTEMALNYYLKSTEYDSERIEGIIYAMNILRTQNKHKEINELYHKYKNYSKKLEGKLFITQSHYMDELEYNNAISANFTEDLLSGYICCKKILINKIISYDKLKHILSYLNVYENFLEQDKYSYNLFYSINHILKIINNKNEKIEPDIINIWNVLFKLNNTYLTKPEISITWNKLNKISSYNEQYKQYTKFPTVFISFTTCKRFDLFQQTVNSILNHWTDVDKINYWFCVDDNSSDEDREQMKNNYSWFDYYMKTPQEKGHRESMNIIWNKIKNLNPTYWIHMEDDFLFHTKMNYIETEYFTSTVKQILFNRNYSETILDYKIKGHYVTENPLLVIHNHNNNKYIYPNCHYWPHYSFRPSITDVQTILTLGNFDSSNQFFERDYADKWTSAGFKSGFFNCITNQHIGRLTSEINTNKVKNAYELNNESQFDKLQYSLLNIKIINLESRLDRKNITINQLENAKIKDYTFIKATVGSTLVPTLKLKTLFKGNDFGTRKGVIGCALSHVQLWQELLDSDNDYYIIMEDDFILCKNFKEKMLQLQKSFVEKEFMFLGYHMFEKERNKVKTLYENDNLEILCQLLNKKLYIGGYFAYSINRQGARILLDYINLNGIKHGIDYLNLIIPNLNSYECYPQLVFSEWNEENKAIDSDIQFNFAVLDFSNTNEIIGFYINPLYCEEIYNYAFYNETILHNKSIIFYDIATNIELEKFEKYFTQIFKLNNFSNIDQIIRDKQITILYNITTTSEVKLANNCKNIIHYKDCTPHGDIFASILPTIQPYVPFIGTPKLNPEHVMKIFNNVFIQPLNLLLYDKFVFIPNMDHNGDDLYHKKQSILSMMEIADKDKKCMGFNSLGFFKSKCINFKPSNYFNTYDGIYVKKYNLIKLNENKIESELNTKNKIKSKNKIIRIQMYCNWCTSKQLCKDWSNMYTEDNIWKNNDNQLQMIYDNIDVDYYVIINSPPQNAFYVPLKTIIFQMEPWVLDPNCNWGTKTWGEWANPDPMKFLAVHGRKTGHHNNAMWQLELTVTDLLKPIIKTEMGISSICSSKYFDEGHIARIDLLKYIENRGYTASESSNPLTSIKGVEPLSIDIFNQDNAHNFKNYKGKLAFDTKSKGMIQYKYYFMMENNFEENYMTEKIWEPILCESLCFYYGCPNLSDYINPLAYVELPITDFEKSYQLIKTAIDEDWWSQRIHIIREEKQKILNKLAFFPTINNIIKLNEVNSKEVNSKEVKSKEVKLNEVRPKVVILIIYSVSNVYKQILQLQKMHLSQFDIQYYFVQMREQENEIEIDDTMIYIKGKESILNILYKTVKAMEYISNNVIFDYLIRSNISTIINVIELIEFLKLAPTKLFYAGGAICNLQLLDPIGGICDNTLMGTDYVMGTSIIFSKDLIDVIINVNLRYDIVDDVSFGLIMKKLNIKINTYITSYINISKLNLNQITNNYIFYRNKSENRYKDIDKIIYMIKLLKK